MSIAKVLVVDDEHNTVDLVRGYLEREGNDVHAAFDGNAALELAGERTPGNAHPSAVGFPLEQILSNPRAVP